ncbi:hypothetical protein HPB50_006962 [Hyalomma asiaticum]|uniref:Uncharacterized protein n=1 Tax=Hyalomma asiaticum TaxID=266040 RepID=A0ACB7TFL7_HYAAI|nr:hypothetical protein HPB50_006962 [Hyalomma asiaticum]
MSISRGFRGCKSRTLQPSSQIPVCVAAYPFDGTAEEECLKPPDFPVVFANLSPLCNRIRYAAAPELRSFSGPNQAWLRKLQGSMLHELPLYASFHDNDEENFNTIAWLYFWSIPYSMAPIPWKLYRYKGRPSAFGDLSFRNAHGRHISIPVAAWSEQKNDAADLHYTCIITTDP